MPVEALSGVPMDVRKRLARTDSIDSAESLGLGPWQWPCLPFPAPECSLTEEEGWVHPGHTRRVPAEGRETPRPGESNGASERGPCNDALAPAGVPGSENGQRGLGTGGVGGVSGAESGGRGLWRKTRNKGFPF